MALLTVTEVAERLGTTERFVRRLIAEKRIEYVKPGGWHVRVEESVVDAFIAAWRVYPQSASRPAVTH
jgi:excisionase family DNA binding protein